MESVLQFFNTWGSMISTLTLMATLFVLILYTIFTNKIRKATEKQIDLTLQPFISFVYDKRDGKFKLINYGKTPALDINFEEIPLIDTGGLNFKYLISRIDFLPPEGKVDIIIKKKINDKITDTDTFDRGALDPLSAHRAFEIKIRYKNAVNDKLIVKGKLGTDTFIFNSIKKISD
jgi:hypothetical protein